MCRDITSAVANTTHNETRGPPNQPRKQTFEFDFISVGYQYHCMSEAFGVLAHLPSMRHLSGYSINGGWSARMPNTAKGIETIDFQNSGIPNAHFGSLLDGTCTLSTFTYTYNAEYNTTNRFCRWDPGEIITYLVRYASDTLKSLKLINVGPIPSAHPDRDYALDVRDIAPTRRDGDDFLGSLKELRQLKHAHIDHTMLIKGTFGNIMWDKDGIKWGVVHRLVDILPPSITSSTLTMKSPSPDSPRILDSLLLTGKKSLPHLEQVVFEGDDFTHEKLMKFIPEDMPAACADARIRLLLDGEDLGCRENNERNNLAIPSIDFGAFEVGPIGGSG